MRKRWGIWVLFLLGFLCCCLPLLAHLYSQKEQKQVIATYQKTIQDQKLDVKELRKQAEHYNSILYQTNGATLSGEDALLLGDASYASLLDTTGTGGIQPAGEYFYICRSQAFGQSGVSVCPQHGFRTDVREPETIHERCVSGSKSASLSVYTGACPETAGGRLDVSAGG